MYIAPTKALCSEKHSDWKRKFNGLGIEVSLVTGDSDVGDITKMGDGNIFITTPEKWDSLTRKWKDNIGFMNCVELVLIDEIHFLGEGKRGSTLEAVVSRMKTVRSHFESEDHRLRFIGASATVSNVIDIAHWLGTATQPAECLQFGDEYRPVRLVSHVDTLGGSYSRVNPWMHDTKLNTMLSSTMHKYNPQLKPTLIFCPTRKSCQVAVQTLKENGGFIIDSNHARKLATVAGTMQDKQLAAGVQKGVGFHHAGLCIQDRKSLEKLFQDGQLPVITCTSTLAVGVNLPAYGPFGELYRKFIATILLIKVDITHQRVSSVPKMVDVVSGENPDELNSNNVRYLVVIKGTSVYRSQGMQEMGMAEVVQMCGRAGRPGFEVEGVAVTLTRQETMGKHSDLSLGQLPIESSMHLELAEHLNAEVALGTVQDIPTALVWLKETFFYVRAKQNPQHYGVSGSADLDQTLQKLALDAIAQLTKISAVSYNDEDMSVVSTLLGKQMVKWYMRYAIYI